MNHCWDAASGLGAPAYLLGHVLMGSMSGALDPSTPLAIQAVCSALRAGVVSFISRKTTWGIDGVAWTQMSASWLQALLLTVAATRKGLLGAEPLRLALGAMLGGEGLATLMAYVSAASLLLIRTGAFQLAMTALSARETTHTHLPSHPHTCPSHASAPASSCMQGCDLVHG